MRHLLAHLALGLALGWLSAPAWAAHNPLDAADGYIPTWSELDERQRADLIEFAAHWDRMPAQRRSRLLARHAHWRGLPEAERRTLREGVRNFRRMPPHLRVKMRASIEAVRDLPPPRQRRLRALWRSMSPEQRREWLERGGPGLAPPSVRVRPARRPPG